MIIDGPPVSCFGLRPYRRGSARGCRPARPVFEIFTVVFLVVLNGVFALSELAYFHGVQKSAENSALAYDTYFLGHAEWFGSDAGRYLLDHLQRRCDRKTRP